MDKEEYLYCTIAITGKQWSFAVRAKTSGTGLATITGRYTGYGNILNPATPQHTLALTVPIINLTGDEAAVKVVLDTPDRLLPRETYPDHGGTVEGYLTHLEKNGVVVIRPPLTVDDYYRNREFLEKNGREFCAHEGLCLQCYNETELTQVSGLPEWLADYPEKIHGTVWQESEWLDDVGEYTYTCPYGHKTVVYVSKYGDHVVA